MATRKRRAATAKTPVAGVVGKAKRSKRKKPARRETTEPKQPDWVRRLAGTANVYAERQCRMAELGRQFGEDLASYEELNRLRARWRTIQHNRRRGFVLARFVFEVMRPTSPWMDLKSPGDWQHHHCENEARAFWAEVLGSEWGTLTDSTEGVVAFCCGALSVLDRYEEITGMEKARGA